uniref:Uncharacterized protein n=1 Tax=Oryza barthii TaxID=65489 RepID=A0A0D3FK18_9ORYZ
MERATGGFSKRNIIGEGGFAIVYKTIGPLLPCPPSYPPLCSSKISMAQTMSALNVLMFIALLAHLTIAYDIHAKTVECIHALRCTIAVALAQVAKNA